MFCSATNVTSKHTPWRRAGFSLIEILMTVALIGVMAAWAFSALSGYRRQVEETRNRRNAQEMANVCAAASAASISFVTAGDVVQSARNIVTGATAAGGAFTGKTFRLPGLSDSDILGAAYYLQISGKMVVYDGSKPNPF